MKYNSFSSKLFTLSAGATRADGRFEYMSLSQSLTVSKEISKVISPDLSPEERKFQVREIALIFSPDVMLIDEETYIDSDINGSIGDPPVRNFVSLSTKDVGMISDVSMWYGQYNYLHANAKHVFCVSNLRTGKCIVFQRSRYKS